MYIVAVLFSFQRLICAVTEEDFMFALPSSLYLRWAADIISWSFKYCKPRDCHGSRFSSLFILAFRYWFMLIDSWYLPSCFPHLIAVLMMGKHSQTSQTALTIHWFARTMDCRTIPSQPEQWISLSSWYCISLSLSTCLTLWCPQVMIVVHAEGENSNMYITEDGGERFTLVHLPFLLENKLLFHPTKEDIIVAHEIATRVLCLHSKRLLSLFIEDVPFTFSLLSIGSFPEYWQGALMDKNQRWCQLCEMVWWASAMCPGTALPKLCIIHILSHVCCQLTGPHMRKIQK